MEFPITKAPWYNLKQIQGLILICLTGYQQPQQTAFVQTNGNYTPVVNGNLTAIRNGPMNGVDYLDASPRSVEYINGAYTHTTVGFRLFTGNGIICNLKI